MARLRSRTRGAVVACVAGLCLASPTTGLRAQAQSGEEPAAAERLGAGNETQTAKERPNVERPPGTRGPKGARAAKQRKPASAKTPGATEPKPYGSQLFTGTKALDRSLAVNPAYEIQPGDRIAVQIWGARKFNDVLHVDRQGNIFIPQIGPVSVDGVRNSNLNSRVKASVDRVYKRNVHVYTNLLGTQPIGVFVSGAVNAPGRYAGNRKDSILYYLTRANAIDEERGSYRNIVVKRDGEVVSEIDLYEFLNTGFLPSFDFHNNDKIVVKNRRATVHVAGDVQNAYTFEIDPQNAVGRNVLDLAYPNPDVSHVMVRGVREGERFSTYVPLADFRNLNLQNGDDLQFFSDRVAQEIVVRVEGNSGGPSSFTVPKGTTLGAFSKLVQIDPELAKPESIFLRRDSVRKRQKEAIERSLQELQRTALTTPSTTTSEAKVRAEEAKLIRQFVERARAVTPEGRVALDDAKDWREVRLQEGDEVVIPQRTQTVLISGEVQVPQTVIFNEEYDVEKYIKQAGGVTKRGDSDNLVVIRGDGSVHTGEKPIRKGDHIMVLPEVGSKVFAMTKDIVEVIFRSAVSAGTVINAVN